MGGGGGGTYSAETEAGEETGVEEAEGEEGDGWDGIDYGEHIVEFELTFSRSMVGFVHVP